ncbi:MAG: HEAT repeat domain-containing protein [Vicinamibacterales bacterium]
MNRLFNVMAASALISAAGCATAPPVVSPPASFEQKMAWILRLEDQRILREAAPAEASVAAPERRGKQAIIAPPQPLDLGHLLQDAEARVRRRAALAVGRVGLAEGVALLVPLLSDPEPEVRQMSAFALGLIGDRSAAEPLRAALEDRSPVVQGRAAEALGRLGDAASAQAIAAMAAAHIRAGALAPVAADEMAHPLDPPVEAVRLALFALARLKAYEPLAGLVLDPDGKPVSQWWPVAYALAQSGDRRALPALLAFARVGGVEARTFAAQGLAGISDPAAVDALVSLAQDWLTAPAAAATAVRSLARTADSRAAKPLLRMLAVAEIDPNVRLEVVKTLGALRAAEATDALLELVSDEWPAMRAASLASLCEIDPKTFLLVLSGLDPDPHWSVRAAIAGIFGTLEPQAAAARLPSMLKDTDQRVIPAVLSAMVRAKLADAPAAALAALEAEDFVVRMAAARALGQLKPPGAFERLSSAYTRWASDETYVARAAALASLAAIDPEGARPILEKALGDREWAVRIRAAELLAGSAQQADVARRIRPAPSRPAEEYSAPELVSPSVTPHVYIETSKGTIQLELYVLDAPQTCRSFIALARKGYFNGVPIHRVVAGFVTQDGDPRGDGEGGPGFTLRDENGERPFLKGTVGMALDWRDTGGSQFFITHGPQPRLDGQYPVFGRVIDGMDVVGRLQQWDTIESVRVWEG